MTLLDKIIDISYNLSHESHQIERCTQPSRTKSDIQETLAVSLLNLKEQNKKLDGYRNTLERPIKLGDETNTIHDELLAIADAIGTAQYYLMKNDILNASAVLNDISKVISVR